jgi:hypothetical protein
MGTKLPVKFNLFLAVSTLLAELMPFLVPLPEQGFLLRLARLLGRLLFRSHHILLFSQTSGPSPSPLEG